MIGYVTLGTNDLARAAKFYDELLAVMGGRRAMETEKYLAWSSDPKGPMLLLIKPNDGQKASVGNGVMVALAAKDRSQVDQVYRKAMELGARDEGAVGPRGEGFYAGYFRDVDGNKLCAFCMG